MNNKFTMTFSMNNDAFAEYPIEEATRVVQEIGKQMEEGQFDGPIRDINGNHIGEYGIN